MLLSLSVLLVTLVTALGFIIRRWWFPAPINQHAAFFDSYFNVNVVVTGVVFLAAQIALAWAIVRFRDRGQKAQYSDGNPRLEIVWSAVTLVIFVAASLVSARIWARVHLAPAAADSVRIEVSGKQFAWNFRYAGADAKFGRTDVRLVNDAAGNPFGVDEKDTAGNDDIVSSQLHVPAGRPVELMLNSYDVLHNFFVRELRIKQDLVPGMRIPLRFQADKPGSYEIACSELCGLGHHQMRSVMVVSPPAEFEQWLREKAADRR